MHTLRSTRKRMRSRASASRSERSDDTRQKAGKKKEACWAYPRNSRHEGLGSSLSKDPQVSFPFGPARSNEARTLLPGPHELLYPQVTLIRISLARFQILEIATGFVPKFGLARDCAKGPLSHLVSSNSFLTRAVPARTSAKMSSSASERVLMSAAKSRRDVSRRTEALPTPHTNRGPWRSRP